MYRVITEDEFAGELRSFRSSAFRLETRDEYAVTAEAGAFRAFLAGHPMTPGQLDWWQEWLDGMRRMTAEGKAVTRVRIVSDPPTDYQRWEMWGTPWHSEAGERILYLTRRDAVRAGVPLDGDWWLLDDERLIDMEFTPAGEPRRKTVVTDPETVAAHRRWRDAAIRHAVTAEQVTAA